MKNILTDHQDIIKVNILNSFEKALKDYEKDNVLYKQ